MTLYDFIKMENSDFDTYDTEFDVEVTVCVPCENINDWYDRFYNFILQHVLFVKKISEYECNADWTKFITDNIDLFVTIANDMWDEDSVPDDLDDMTYEWIKELEGLLAGYGSEDVYEHFMKVYSNQFVGVDE